MKYGKWLSRGYRHFSLLPFFEGPPTFEKKIALLFLTGFEKERAVSLIDDIEPEAVFLALAEPGTDATFQSESKKTLKEIKDRSSAQAEVLNIVGNDPFRSKKTLQDLFLKHSREFDFFVAPIGSKPALVGLYLAYEEKPMFRVIYPLIYLRLDQHPIAKF
jgi:hypothetical protein